MRVVVDVSPLSHPRTGVGNYIRGSLLGLAQTDNEIVAFAPASRLGKRLIEASLAGASRSYRRRTRCGHSGAVSAGRRSSGSSAGSTSSTSATGCIRRNAAACARR
jgi:hypothetical protein